MKKYDRALFAGHALAGANLAPAGNRAPFLIACNLYHN
jgi:hypothetical protein